MFVEYASRIVSYDLLPMERVLADAIQGDGDETVKFICFSH